MFAIIRGRSLALAWRLNTWLAVTAIILSWMIVNV